MLDSIRYKARHLARKAEDGDHWAIRYMPFQRSDSNYGARRLHDEESNDLHPIESAHSETCVASSNERDPPSFQHPQHASTAPAGSNPTSPVDGHVQHEHHHIGHEKKEPDFSPSVDSVTPFTKPTANSQLRKRDRVKKFVPFMKKSQDPEEEESKLRRQKSKKNKFAKSDKELTVKSQLIAVFGSWINILLVCVPIGIALNYAGVSGTAVFVVNFIAIIPLAGLLSYATEEIAMRVGETLGGLLNASFGNAVELIISIIALAQDKILIVKTSLIGSMLSNLLLVMGMCFFFGGLGKLEQYFNVTVAQTAASLLALAVGSLLIPTFFDQGSNNSGSDEQRAAQVPALSRGVAVILLVVYICYLTFQLKTHATMFSETGGKARKDESKQQYDGNSISRGIASIGAGTAAASGGEINKQKLPSKQEDEDDEDMETPKLTPIGAIITLCVATAFVGLCSEFMVDGIGAVADKISPEFIGLILIPIVGNAAEHATAVTVAIKDKMDLAIGVAVGSSLQIALFVLPVTVIVGWILNAFHPEWALEQIMTLEFDVFQIGLLFVAIILVNYLIQDGASHWLEGVMLMSTYIMIAVAAWFYPTNPGEELFR